MRQPNDNVFDMEKEHMKKVILSLSRRHGKSPSQLAQEAGIAPSTITGFLNDRDGRAKHGLSAQTQNKLEKTFPEFSEAFDRPAFENELVELSIIGQWSAQYSVYTLEPGLPSSVACENFSNVKNKRAIVETNNAFQQKSKSHYRMNSYRLDNKYYIFTNKFLDNLEITHGRLVYAKSEYGSFYMGIATKEKDKFILRKYNGDVIEDCGYIVGATLIEWCYFAP
tara:strand:+ start:47 stop:718 length:672 start_codon:yes stop_codon:yes gene_type:complete